MRTDCCQTRYPIVLVHGMNCRDDRPIFYWGRIPDVLRARGARVYLSGQDAWGTVAGNARQLQQAVQRVLEAEHCEKVNFVAHSKGGLEVRYLISKLGMAGQAASLTTLSTPHHGSRTAQWMGARRLLTPYGLCSNQFWRLLGDQSPDFFQTLHDLSADWAEDFNRECPDAPGVYYQSWGARLGGSAHDPIMSLFGAVCRPFDGETDGLVSAKSSEWGNYRGTLDRVSHQYLADALQRDLPHFRPCAFHVRLVRELAKNGF
ncbi:MAG: hypothetical protein K2O74_04210 [Eubacteriales bacterium]|nr:hypothetical protein [Eubacteriales bacterium]